MGENLKTKLENERAQYEQQNLELSKELETAHIDFKNTKKSIGRRIIMNRKRVELINQEMHEYGYETGDNTPPLATDTGDVQQNP